jgi:hypothetical protein
MRGGEKFILADPWGLHFDALESGSGRMEREDFVVLLRRCQDIV